MQIKNINKLIVSIVICELAGVIGSIFTTPAISGWYQTIQKPWFTPPGWVIGAVWIILFALMGAALYLVWQKGTDNWEAKKGLKFFSIQLAFNIIWSYLFFGLRNPFYAFVEIILLWLTITITLYQFSKVSKPASYLLLPYLIWVTFAAYLNFTIWRLNS